MKPGDAMPLQPGEAIVPLKSSEAIAPLKPGEAIPLKSGDAIAPLLLTPAADVASRYADASGDSNPIHLDPEVARAAGLPRPILHGMYTMALVARCARHAGGRRQLRRLAVDFRAPGFPGEAIEVSGAVREISGTRLSLSLVVRQDGRRIIRNASAELEEEVLPLG